MIVRGGTVVTSRGSAVADIAIEDGRIVDVGGTVGGAAEEIDAGGLWVLPGGIDSHVHFNEPGRTEWEDISHGSAALAAGGYTAFVDMPLNNLPVTTTVEAFDLKLDAMRRSSRLDFGLWGGLVPGNLDQLEPLHRRGAFGFKAFMCPSGIDEFPMCDGTVLRQGMERIAELDSILLVHAEHPAALVEPLGPGWKAFVDSRPPEAEWTAIDEAIEVARETGCRLHVVHVSTPEGLSRIDLAHASGVDVSGETCPHYLLYSPRDLQLLGGLGKCAPPFRAGPKRELWNAPIVVSDHSPSTLALKQGADFRTIWGGISGCQSTRQLLLAQNRLEAPTIAAATSTNVARRFGLKDKGDIAAGFDADLWIVDPGRLDVVRREDLMYKNPFSAHEGKPIRGRTVHTLLRGRPAGEKPGRPLARE